MAKKDSKTEKVENVNEGLEQEIASAELSGFVELAENLEDMNVECVGTGFPQLDIVLQPTQKGLPKGRDIEIYSRDAEVGKSTLAMQILKNWQKAGLRTLVVEREKTTTRPYLETLGVITDPKQDPAKFAVRFHWPEERESAEVILEAIKKASQIFDLIVVDSLTTLEPQSNIEKTLEDPEQMGTLAKLMSRFLRENLNKRATIIWINQSRQSLGFNPTGQVSYVQSGGRALRFYATIRLELSIIEKMTQGKDEDPWAYKVKAFTFKNKIAPQWRSAMLTYVFGEGFSQIYDYMDLGLRDGIIEKNKGWFEFGGVKVQGERNLYLKLKGDKELFEVLRRSVQGEDLIPSEAQV